MEDKFLNDDTTMHDLLQGMPEKVNTGTIVQARVLEKSADGVIVDVGVKMDALIPKNEFPEFEKSLPFNVGDTIPVLVQTISQREGETRASWKAAHERAAWEKLAASRQGELPVEAIVRKKVKGGYIADIGVDAFLPGSQLDVRPVHDPQSWINKTITVLITEMDRAKSNVVVSRRKWVEKENARQKEITLASLKEGEVREGIVSSITKFGAFIDIGGIEGLLHVSDISWHRTEKIEKHLKTGQTVKVKVLKFDTAAQRISLGMKQLTPHPWEGIQSRYTAGNTVTGTVTSLTSFGAFLQLEPGVEGLIHNSEFSWKDRNAKPEQFVKKNETVTAMIILVDAAKEKISLSLKRMSQSPWELIKTNYPAGTHVECPVTHLTPFGAFLMLPEGIEGLVHISDFSWTKRINHPDEMVAVGQKVEAVVLDVMPESEKIVLSLKHLTKDPLLSMKKGDVVTGKVTEASDKSAAVELSSGIRAHVRGSELAEDGEKNKIIPTAGQEITAKVIEVKVRERGVELSIRRYEKDQERQMLARYDGKKQDPLTLGDILVDPSEES
jgi:small subunit ribosomal protein S1